MSTTGDHRAFTPPERFSFDPREWPLWKKRFEHYRTLTKMEKESEEFQCHALIYCMGEKSDDIMASFNMSTADSKDYAKVMKKFDDHFVGKRNVVYERARFGMRCQVAGETVETFVTSLHTLSEHCDYGALKDSLVRDRIVLGVLDKKLSEKLMLMETLDLTKAVEVSKQWEAVKRQQGDLQGDGKAKSLDAVGKKNKSSRHQRSNNQQQQKGKPSDKGKEDSTEKKCKFCNLSHEMVREKCPAFGKNCHKCGEDGHFASCCKRLPKEKESSSTSMNRVACSAESSFMLGSLQMDSLDSDQTRAKRWSSEILVDDKPIDFKLDPGADVTAVPYHLFRKHWRNRRIHVSDKLLSGPDGSRLSIVGTARCKLKNKDVEITDNIYVVKGLERPLLGVRACEDLQLVMRMDSVESESLSHVKPTEEFPELFTGLGRLDTPYTIKLSDGAKPFAVHAPRRIPIPLLEKVKKKLEEMVEEGVIERVDEPTEWCAPLVTAPKPQGDIRMCVDLTALNRSVKRELHPMPVVEHTLGQLAGARIFTKLDANSGFYQILLSPESRSLTTFITPFGRYRYRRLPFGITSAPEHFQKRMMDILEGLPGVVLHVDDMLIWGRTVKEHDARLRAVLRRLKDAGITLNKEKCVFGVPLIKFLGHIIDENGVRPDPEKVEAIEKFPAPSTVTEVKRFLGMTNYLGRFIPHLSEWSKPLYALTKANTEFIWGPIQQQSFDKIKQILVKEPTLALYDPNKETVVSSDASSYGLGSVLLQKQEDGNLKPVAYGSRTMTTAEQRYAQIEKEALAIVWACERFRDFLMGTTFMIETDHKPLLPILRTKCVDDLSPRLQRFRIRMMRYSYDIKYTPGKELVTADALSRQPLSQTGDKEFQDEVAAYVCHVVSSLPASDEKLSEIWTAQQKDPVLQRVMVCCTEGWPEKCTKMDAELKKYWTVRDEITIQNGLLLRNSRIVIPKKLQDEMLGRIHEGHLGVVKCRARARESCWWPGQSEDIAEVVRRCPVCVQERIERKEPLIPSEFPTRPWMKVGMDLFQLNGNWFILVVDYFSRFPEVAQLSSTTTAAVIDKLKVFFSRHGVPEEVISDNGPQFHPLKTSPFQQFAREYGFLHSTSSPRYPQSNGFAENGVKIVKNLLKKNTDWYKALLEYRASPLANGFSPAELLMGRRIRSTLPVNPTSLIPTDVDKDELVEKEEIRRNKQKKAYDHHHGVVAKQELSEGEIVWIKDLRIWGKITGVAGTPRSYLVDTPRGSFRRNSSHLTRGFTDAVPESLVELEFEDVAEDLLPDAEQQPPLEPIPEPNAASPSYRTRFGRVVKPRRRLIEEL
ncbi:unnamed protein product [Orchesella dallaii]|uniref:RNA-directed DNA polymerase n=1 Tax=Orchesella dallaii TaxID=48710 RepID=A0ABP1PMD6_9HEXA